MRTRALDVTAALVVVLVVAAACVAVTRVASADGGRCERFASDAAARADAVSGRGERVVVIGDSWSAGLGLRRPAESWPSRLPGRVHVDGFSGSGFSAGASPCGRVSFADRAARPALADGALATADLVVVEGGLNDWDHTDAEIRAGFARLVAGLRAAGDARVVVVGPASAPSRAARVPHLDALLGRLSAAHGVAYVPTADLDLAYLDDRLHLTAAGHREFGDAVARRIGALD